MKRRRGLADISSHITPQQIRHRLAPLDQPGLAVLDPDHGRPPGGVVVAAHAELVGAAGRHGQQIAWPQRWQVDVVDQDVTGLAVGAGDVYALRRARR